MADQNSIAQKELDELLSGISDTPLSPPQEEISSLDIPGTTLKEQPGLGLDTDSINALVGNIGSATSNKSSENTGFGDLGSLSTQSPAKIENIDLLKDVTLRFTVELGRTEMLIKDVMRLDEGSLVELDRDEGDEVDIYINDCIFAHGKLFIVDEEFYGVQILRIINSNPISNYKIG